MNGGKSVLNQLGCDAEDFNPKLHEHFQIARRAGMKPGGTEEGTHSKYADLEHPSGTHGMSIEHSRKTGEVRSHVASVNGEVIYNHMKSPSDVRQALKEARKVAK
jgi:hypothetical protein